MTIITPNCTPVVGCEKNATVWKPSVTWRTSAWWKTATPCSCVQFRMAIPWPCHNLWPAWSAFICWNTAAGGMICSFRDDVSSHSFSLLMQSAKNLERAWKKKKKAVPLFSLKLSFRQDDWRKSHWDLVKQRVPWAYGVCCFCSEESTNYDLGWSLLSVLVA